MEACRFGFASARGEFLETSEVASLRPSALAAT
jgi:hypothetical protein